MPTIQVYKGDSIYFPSSSNPKYGVGPAGITTEQGIDTYLTNEMPDQQPGQVSYSTAENQYFYFMSPKALGSVTFVDADTQLPGGMDGATWPAGQIGETTGPLVVSYQGEQWYLYRSDFDNHGAKTVNVSYTDPIAPAPYPTSIAITGPSSVDETVGGSLTATVTYSDSSTEIRTTESSWISSDETVLTVAADGTFTTEVIDASTTVTVTATYSEQGRTVQTQHEVLVKDVSATPTSSQIVGPTTLSSGATHTYVLEVTYSDNSKVNVPAAWAATGTYLTINSSTGEATAGAPTSDTISTITATKTVDGVDVSTTLDVTVQASTADLTPRYGVGNFGFNVATEADLDSLSVVPDDSNPHQITLTAGASEYMYYASPVSRGSATFVDTSNSMPGGWDGATWESGFDSKTGPLEVTYQGVQWYVYRTDWEGLGTKTWNVTHS